MSAKQDCNKDTTDDIEAFHRSKIDTKSELEVKIEKVLKNRTERLPIQLPNGLQLTTNLYVPKPLRATIHITSSTHETYVAHYGAGPENGVCTWTRERGELKIRKRRMKLDCRITNIVYIPSTYVYFVSCTDLTVRTYNTQFREYNRLQMQHSILFLLHDERLHQTLAGCVGSVQTWRLGHLLDPPILTHQVMLEDPVTGVTPWITFIHNDRQSNRYIALTGTAVFFLHAETLQLLGYLENRHAFPMTCCVTYSFRHYLITGSKNGNIKVWSTCVNNFPFVAELLGHLKAIISLAMHPKEQVLISSSQDSTIRVWRLETLTETFRFHVLDQIKSSVLISAQKFYYTMGNGIRLLDLHLFHKLFTLLGSQVNSIKRYPSLTKASRLIVIAEDGGVRLVSPLHGNVLTMLFPVVTHKPKAYVHDLSDERIYILLEDGNALVACTKTNPCQSIEYYKAEYPDDGLVALQVVQWDSEMELKTFLLGSHADGRITLLRGKGYNMKIVTPNHGIIHAIEPAPRNSLQYFNFITRSSEKHLNVWKIIGNFETSRLYCQLLVDIPLDYDASCLAINHCTIAFCYVNKINFMQLKLLTDLEDTRDLRDKFSMTLMTHTSDEGHRDKINALCGDTNLCIFASASANGDVKIWSESAVLIREISFGHDFSGLSFANDRGDLIFGFQGNLHFISVIDYLPNKYLSLLLKEDYEDEGKEYCRQFDAGLNFWYDRERVPTLPMTKTNVHKLRRRMAMQPMNHAPLIVKDSADLTVADLNTHSIRRWRLLKHVLQTSGNVPMKKIVLSSGLPRNYTPTIKESSQTSLTSNTSKEKMDTDEESETESENSLDTEGTNNDADNADVIVKKYWPCAPDGFIPNSVVRDVVKPIRPAIEIVSLQPWAPKPVDYSSDDEVYLTTPDILDDDESFYEEERCWESTDESSMSPELSSLDVNEIVVEEIPEDKPEEKVIVEKKLLHTPTKYVAKPTPRQKIQKIREEEEKEEEFGIKVILETPADIAKQESIIEMENQVIEEKEDEETNENDEDHLKESEEEDADKIIVVPPPPYDKYIDEKWFPISLDFTVEAIVPALFNNINDGDVFEFRDILACIADIHKVVGLTSDLLDNALTILKSYLEHPSGKIRYYAVNTLVLLGEERKDVMILLIKRLADPDQSVREQIKEALDEIAGIHCAETLTNKLKEYGALHEPEPPTNDANVLQEFTTKILENKDKLLKAISSSSNVNPSITSMRTAAWLEEIERKRNKLNQRRNSAEIKSGVINDWQAMMSGKRKSKKSSLLLQQSGESTNTQVDVVIEEDNTQIHYQTVNNKNLSTLQVPSNGQCPLTPDNSEMNTKRPKRRNRAVPVGSRYNVRTDRSKTMIGLSKKTSLVNSISDESEENLVEPDQLKYPLFPKDSSIFVETSNDSLISEEWTGFINNVFFEHLELPAEEIMEYLAPTVFEKYELLSQEQKNNLISGVINEEKISYHTSEDSSIKGKLEQILSLKLEESIDTYTEKEVTIKVPKQDSIKQKEGKKNVKKTQNETIHDQKIKKLQKMIITNACDVLRLHRKNHKNATKKSLADSLLLIQVLENKETLNGKVIDKFFKLVLEMREECGLDKQSSEDHIRKFNSKKLDPRFERVPGVNGERIVDEISVLSQMRIKRTIDATRMKPIPERNGFYTVSHSTGKTPYGQLQLHWSTYTTDYDMKKRSFESLGTKRTNKHIVRSYKYQRGQELLAPLPEHVKHRLQTNTPASAYQTVFSQTPLLPKIRDSIDQTQMMKAKELNAGVNNNQMLKIPLIAPPNTASG